MVLYLLVAVVFTYPLILNLSSRVLIDTGDPLYNTWVINWNIHALLTNPLRLFDANVFYPYKNTLVFSDVFLAPSLMALPLLLLTRNPLAAYNLLVIFFYAFSGWAMFLLARHLTQNVYISFLVGMAYAFSSYRYAHMGHLQLLSDGFLVLAVLFAHKYLRLQQFKYLSLAGIFLIIQASSSWYYGIYSLMFLIAFLVFFTITGRLKAALLIKHSAPVLALIAVALAPLAWPYLNVHRMMPQFERTLVEAHFFAARPWSYLTVLPGNLLLGRPLSFLFLKTGGIWEKALFPGLASTICAAWASAAVINPKKFRDHLWQIKFFYLCLVLTGITLSFGPYVFLGKTQFWLPYRFLYDWVPGFKGMRVPARFGLMVTVGISVLAAIGMQDIYQRLKKKQVIKAGSGVKIAGAAALLILVAGSQISWPVKLSDYVPSGKNVPPIYRFLANEKDKGALIELPSIKFGPAGEMVESIWMKETIYMYYSIYHWHPIVNGYSGFSPPVYTAVMKEMQRFPSRRSLDMLKGLKVEHVLVHSKSLPVSVCNGQRQALSAAPGVILEKQINGDYLYRLKKDRPLAGKKAVMIKAIKGPSAVPPNTEINLAVLVVNTSRRPVVVPPEMQLKSDIIWQQTGRRERYEPQLPVLLEPKETAWLPIQVVTPSDGGKYKLNMHFRSPVLASKYYSLSFKTAASMGDSTKTGAKLGNKFLLINKPDVAAAGRLFNLGLKVKNTGNSLWITHYTPQMETKEPINLGEVHVIAKWRQPGRPAASVERLFQVAFINYDIGPGEIVDVNFPVRAPRSPGSYELDLNMAALGIGRFSDRASSILKLPITVER